MNDKQKITLWVGSVVILLMVLFPPSYRPYGGDYDFIAEQLNDIEYGILLLQILAVAVITAVGFFTLKDKSDNE